MQLTVTAQITQQTVLLIEEPYGGIVAACDPIALPAVQTETTYLVAFLLREVLIGFLTEREFEDTIAAGKPCITLLVGCTETDTIHAMPVVRVVHITASYRIFISQLPVLTNGPFCAVDVFIISRNARWLCSIVSVKSSILSSTT